MSMEKTLKEILDEILDEVEQELEEATTTAGVDGYQTPFAFGAGRKKDKKKEKETATQAGYTLAESVNEAKDIVTIAKPGYYLTKSYFKIDGGGWVINFKKGSILKVSKDGTTEKWDTKKGSWVNIKPSVSSHDNLDLSRFGKPDVTKWQANFKKSTTLLKNSDVKKYLTKESVNEAKSKRPVNRWLELKNDESMHPHKKMAMGLKELKYQLREVEKFFNWYNKIKTINELDSDKYWKRTNRHIYTIKEKLIKIAKTIQEIEK